MTHPVPRALSPPWNEPLWSERIDAALAQIDLAWKPSQVGAAVHYLALLQRWNAAFNLTAITDPQQMLVQHLFDSLAVARFLSGNAALDLGTGAGLPGIPLAIDQPARRFTLLDANGKKIRFIRQAMIELRLTNAAAVQTRVADFQPPSEFDCIVSRAYSSLRQFVDDARRLCAPGGVLLAMKARLQSDELAAIESDCDYRVEPLTVPGLAAERHLVIIAN
ncbi:MAG: 16S rRNA (guanine(527)-N(7))-methyltransferase RsmG [Thiotrichales bacterium]